VYGRFCGKTVFFERYLSSLQTPALAKYRVFNHFRIANCGSNNPQAFPSLKHFLPRFFSLYNFAWAANSQANQALPTIRDRPVVLGYVAGQE
jgi:hypothetical protein